MTCPYKKTDSKLFSTMWDFLGTFLAVLSRHFVIREFCFISYLQCVSTRFFSWWYWSSSLSSTADFCTHQTTPSDLVYECSSWNVIGRTECDMRMTINSLPEFVHEDLSTFFQMFFWLPGSTTLSLLTRWLRRLCRALYLRKSIERASVLIWHIKRTLGWKKKFDIWAENFIQGKINFFLGTKLLLLRRRQWWVVECAKALQIFYTFAIRLVF